MAMSIVVVFVVVVVVVAVFRFPWSFSNCFCFSSLQVWQQSIHLQHQTNHKRLPKKIRKNYIHDNLFDSTKIK
jgi:hypothetical protein